MKTGSFSTKATTGRHMRRRAKAASGIRRTRGAPAAPQPQLELVLPPAARRGRGGPRAGSGRKRANPLTKRNALHRARPEHSARCPVHVTMRAKKGVGIPSFRSEVVQRLLKEALQRQSQRDYGDAFQIVHFSIQSDHVHLIAEAKAPDPAKVVQHPRLVSQRAKRGLETKERDMLRRGIAGFAISFARQLNKLLDRKGSVWGDRHHRRDLANPTDVRNTLLYVLQNARHHGARAFGPALDAFSTAMTFDGWLERDARALVEAPWRPPPRTWLLARGWQRAGGPLSAYDGPPLAPFVKLAPYEPETVEHNVSDARLRELGVLD